MKRKCGKETFQYSAMSLIIRTTVELLLYGYGAIEIHLISYLIPYGDCKVQEKFPDTFKFGVGVAAYQIDKPWNTSDKSFGTISVSILSQLLIMVLIHLHFKKILE
jgi:hypothetical protein